MSSSAPPIIQSAERLMLAIEQAVRQFPRYHKYTLGTEIRQGAMEVGRLAHRAWREKDGQGEWIDQLVWSIDDLKLRMQLGQQVRAWASLRQFEHLSRLAHDVGRQAGGWRKRHRSGQNSGSSASPERAKTLSARTASQGATS